MFTFYIAWKAAQAIQRMQKEKREDRIKYEKEIKILKKEVHRLLLKK